MMNTVKIGILGAPRARSLFNVIKEIPDCKLTTVCNRDGEAFEAFKNFASKRREPLTYVNTFEELLSSDVDLIILCNYADDHAPYAVQALKAGKHVLSELMSFVNLKEAVELVEAVEESGMEYALFDQTSHKDTLDYFKTIISPEDIVKIQSEDSYRSYARKKNLSNNWRRYASTTTYTTHELGAAVNFMKKHPVSVTASEQWGGPRAYRSTINLTFDNGATIQHVRMGGNYAPQRKISELVFTDKNNVRWLVDDRRIIKYTDGTDPVIVYSKENDVSVYHEGCKRCISLMVDKILGKEGDYSSLHDVYEASDITLAGILGFKSIVKENSEITMPDLKDKSIRDLYRNDTFCTFPDKAGEMYVPASYSRTKTEA